MTKTTILAATAATIATALLAIPLLAGSANASVTSKLMGCQFNTKSKVVDCCQRILRNEVRPQWMTRSQDSCSAATVCVGGNGPLAMIAATTPNSRRCKIVILNTPETEGGRDIPRAQRGKN